MQHCGHSFLFVYMREILKILREGASLLGVVLNKHVEPTSLTWIFLILEESWYV